MEEKLNYYEILDLKGKGDASRLSPQDLKAAYRRALLLHHPDKNGLNGERTVVTVDDIALAYKTLSEARLKADYDHWLESNNGEAAAGAVSRPHHTGLETVDLDDLDFEPHSNSWSRDCRCGDAKGYIVTETDLESNIDDGELIIGCKGCSLWLRVLFSVEE